MIGGPGTRNPKQFELRLASLASVTRNILTYTWLALARVNQNISSLLLAGQARLAQTI